MIYTISKTYKRLKQKPLFDKVGRRFQLDRRFFQYGFFSPDNRGAKDRRTGLDRRKHLRYDPYSETGQQDNKKIEDVFFNKLTASINTEPFYPQEKKEIKATTEQGSMVPKSGQSPTHGHPPKHWQFIDPLDEVIFSEVLKRELGEMAYIVYSIDTYNAYRLTDDQRKLFESSSDSELSCIRIDIYSRNDLLKPFNILGIKREQACQHPK